MNRPLLQANCRLMDIGGGRGRMVRILFTMTMWVVAAQWVYNETKLMAPGLVPYIDSTLSFIQIPTHDQWDASGVKQLVAQLFPERARGQTIVTESFSGLSEYLPAHEVRVETVRRPKGYEVF